jgi:hypothetical protein
MTAIQPPRFVRANTLLILAVSLVLAWDAAGQELHEFQKLTASDAAASHRFGESVAISGNVAVVGAHGDNEAGQLSGAAYIYLDNGSGTWNQIAKLIASDAAPFDVFGRSVAISGNTVIVGA